MNTYQGKIRIDVAEDGTGRLLVDCDIFEFCKAHGLSLAINLSKPAEACNCGRWSEDGHHATCPQSKAHSVKRDMPNPEGPANYQSEAGLKELEKYRQERTRGHGRPERSS